MVEIYLVLELNRRQKDLVILSKVSDCVKFSISSRLFLVFLHLALISISAERYVSRLSVGSSTKALVQG